MRFHWYWPFARSEELDWAVWTARPGESIVVQVIDREPAPSAGVHGPVTVVRDLPDVDRSVSRALWAPSRARTYVKRAQARRAMWQATSFDLVHLHYVNRFTDAVARLPSPVVLSVHDVVPHRARLGRAEHQVLRRTYHRSDALVVHHDTLREQLIGEFGVDPARVHVVQHQVFSAPEVAAPPTNEPPVVLFFGALRANKGLPDFLRAVDSLRGADIRFVVAGRGDPDMEALARVAAANDPRVRAEIGFVTLDRKRELFAQSSVIALPYTSFASQSGVLHDAYGHGRPVVVTDAGALGRSVREDGTGLVAERRDPDGLAARIVEALEPAAWSRFAQAALRVRRERSPRSTGVRLRTVYDDVLS